MNSNVILKHAFRLPRGHLTTMTLLLLQPHAIWYVWHAQLHHVRYLDPVGRPHKVVHQPQPHACQLGHHTRVSPIHQLLTRVDHVVAHVAVAEYMVSMMRNQPALQRTTKTHKTLIHSLHML